jgi:hypothetical protein
MFNASIRQCVVLLATASASLFVLSGCTARAVVAEPVYATTTYVEPVRTSVYVAPAPVYVPPPPVIVERPVVVARPVIVERPVVATRVYTPAPTVVVQPRARVVVEGRRWH